jgi:cell division protein FtsI (penicillin-binding protein 3)
VSAPSLLPPVRRRAVLAALLLGGALLVARLVELQVVRHDLLLARARGQLQDVVEIPGPRGNIYDRDEQLLATSVPVEVLAVEPRKLNPNILGAIEAAAGAERGRLTERAGARWVIVRRDCDGATRAAVQRLIDKGLVPKDAIWWEPGYERSYPLGPRAAHVLGYISLDGERAEGVERYYDRMLRTAGTSVSLTMDARRNRVDVAGAGPDADEGLALMLTIDVRIQAVLEAALAEAVEVNGAKAAQGVVLDPRTGEVLAMAVAPDYDPNDYGRFPLDRHRNRLIELPFEPGSVMKPFTAAALVASGSVRGTESVYCEMGRWHLSKSRTLCDVARHGTLTLPEVIQVSSNIGIVKFSRRLSSGEMYRTLAGLGFGQKSGIDLPLESPGVLHAASRWSHADKDSIAFGHSLSVTPLQLASAVGTIANGGVRVRPRVARAFGGPGSWQPYVGTAPETVLSREAAATITRWMRRVVEEERATGHRAAIPGYTVAGKTGTAEKLTNGHFDKGKNIASFVGFAPATAPAAVVVISLDEPHLVGRTGGVVAAPVFARVMGETLRLLRVPPDRPDDPKLLEVKQKLAEEAEELLAENAPTEEPEEEQEPPLPATVAATIAPAALTLPPPAREAAGTAARPSQRTAAKPGAKPTAKSAAKPAAKPAASSAAKPAAKPAAKSVAKPAAKPAPKPAAKPAESR